MSPDSFGQLCSERLLAYGTTPAGKDLWNETTARATATIQIGASRLYYQRPRISKHDTGLGSTYGLTVSSGRTVAVIAYRRRFTSPWRYSWVGPRPSKADETEIRLLL